MQNRNDRPSDVHRVISLCWSTLEEYQLNAIDVLVISYYFMIEALTQSDAPDNVVKLIAQGIRDKDRTVTWPSPSEIDDTASTEHPQASPVPEVMH